MKTPMLLLALLLAAPMTAQQKLSDGIKELATQISATATRQDKQKIAVLPFRELEGQSTVLGTYLSEELVTSLFQLGNFRIVERQLLDKLLGELKIEQTGAIDPRTAKEIGRIAGVDAIVTGSITDLESSIGVNCRVIDTATGEVFGAAKTRIIKDDDVTKIMRTVLSPDGTTTRGPTSHASSIIATRELGLLRVALKSILPSAHNGLRVTFDLTNRDAHETMVAALNAEAPSTDPYSYVAAPIRLRASILDDHGNTWKLAAQHLSGIGYVRVGVHGRNGQDAYDPTEISRLLRLRDQLGRSTDDPSDGIQARATSMGEGGMNVTFGAGGNTSPEQFFPYRGNTFVSGATTPIAPGQTMTVMMTFEPEGPQSVALPIAFQFQAEMIAGTKSTTYTLHTLAFDRISMSAQ